jgi:hypothetical protein
MAIDKDKDKYLIRRAIKIASLIEILQEECMEPRVPAFLEREQHSNDQLLDAIEEWGGMSREFTERVLRAVRGD